MKPTLIIALENGNGKTLVLARLDDAGLLVAAARAVIDEKWRMAQCVSREDGALGVVASAEAKRVELALGELIPGTTDSPALRVQ